MNSSIFWAILLFISGCVIIHLCRYISELKESISIGTIEEAMKRWDNEYTSLISHYGSIEDFEEAFKKDFDMFRSNVLVFISRISEIRNGINRAITYVEKGCSKTTGDITLIKLQALQKGVDSAIASLVEDMTNFIKCEEEAHQDYKYVDEVLKKLSEEIKEINFYE